MTRRRKGTGDRGMGPGERGGGTGGAKDEDIARGLSWSGTLVCQSSGDGSANKSDGNDEDDSFGCSK